MKIKCESCNKLIKKNPVIFWKKYCSNNCRQRAWYKRNLKKAVILAFLITASSAFAETGKASWYSTEACKYNPEKHCPPEDGSSLYTSENHGEFSPAYKAPPLGPWLGLPNNGPAKNIS